MDESAYEDLDQETAIALGTLSELTAIRQALERIAFALDGGIDEDADAGDEQDVLHCTACDVDVLESDAKTHAVQEHNAPVDGEFWRRTYEQEAA